MTLAASVLLVLVACSTDNPTTTGPTTSGTDGTGSLGTVTELPAPPTAEPSDGGVESRTTYPFGVPSSAVTINHPAPAPNLPRLVAVYVGDHPEGDPAFQRVSFYFRGGFPTYRFQFVPTIVQDATGDPIPLDAAYALSVVFVGAQAHDDDGDSTVAESPSRPIGFSALRDLAAAGDFEGQVSYGIGVIEAGDSPAAIRVGELERPDNAGGSFFVVYFDVRAG